MPSLAVKYRPQSFNEIIGQDSVIKILNRQLEENKIKNCLLFSGASGDGKTTTARAYARAVNEGKGNPIEIDAASNNGVDNIREIIKSANERSLDSKYKVIILDESHVLSNSAWQALLKTIEEPPKYTIFIFCTTDPQKIPQTILNRVMRFNFTRISADKINQRLQYICRQEGFTDYEESCDYISRICNGEMRNAISMLEKCADYSNSITLENTLQAIGNFSYTIFFKLINGIIDTDEKSTLNIINDIYNSGSDLKLFADQFLEFCLDINKYAIFQDFSVTKIPKSMEKDLQYSIGFDNATKYYSYIIDKLLGLKNMLKNDNSPKNTIETVFLQMCRLV